jgi:hypothetical protein
MEAWAKWAGVVVFGTALPLVGLWLMYDGLEHVLPGLGRAVAGLLVLAYAFIVSRLFKP